MKLIACVDENMGMMFNHRRQSQDRILRTHMLEMTAGGRLCLSAYSARQFGLETDTGQTGGLRVQVNGQAQTEICIVEEPGRKAGELDYCFVEDVDPASLTAQIDELILFHWNRKYPADLFCSLTPAEPDWRLIETDEFAGSSHEKITMTRWQRVI